MSNICTLRNSSSINCQQLTKNERGTSKTSASIPYYDTILVTKESVSTYLVDEEHSGNQLCHALIDVAIHDAIDFSAQLLRYLCLLRFSQLSHHGQDVLAALGTSI